MAIDRWIEIDGHRTPGDALVHLRSEQEPGVVEIPLDVASPGEVRPEWGRYVAGVVAELRPEAGFRGLVRSTVPAQSGLSSSAALEVAAALVLGADPADPLALAQLCRRAEHRARGVPTGILDQLACVAGVAGHALVLDCHELTVRPTPLPPDDEASVVVVPGHARSLGDSGYTERVRECQAAEAEIGPLRRATLDDVTRISDPVVRARARHVVTENARVEALATALAAGNLVAAGRLMDESHESLRGDYASSTARIDTLWAGLRATDGVFGARMTGGGWGGCVVALCRPGALGDLGWPVRAVDGATLL
jgi:galactokinase